MRKGDSGGKEMLQGLSIGMSRKHGNRADCGGGILGCHREISESITRVGNRKLYLKVWDGSVINPSGQHALAFCF